MKQPSIDLHMYSVFENHPKCLTFKMRLRVIFFSRKTYHQKDLLQSSNSPSVPRCFEINTIGVATNQVFRQNHYETLKKSENQI